MTVKLGRNPNMGQVMNLKLRKMQIAVLALAVVAFMAVIPAPYNKTWHDFAWAQGSVPDQYGQQIYAVVIEQNVSGGDYLSPIVMVMASNEPEGNYSSGMALSITSNLATQIVVNVLMNNTLITGSPSDNTRVYLNVTGVYSNQAMAYAIYSPNSPLTGFDDVTFEYPSSSPYWTPAPSTTYNISILYQAYY